MRTDAIQVGDIVLKVPVPENMDELRVLVNTTDDLFYLALRGFDQVRRTHLRSMQKRGFDKKTLQSRASNYWYQHQKKFDGRPRNINPGG